MNRPPCAHCGNRDYDESYIPTCHATERCRNEVEGLEKAHLEQKARAEAAEAKLRDLQEVFDLVVAEKMKALDERDANLKHANEGWRLANERTRQWKDAERLVGEHKVLLGEACNWLHAAAPLHARGPEIRSLADRCHDAYEGKGTPRPVCEEVVIGDADKERCGMALPCPLHRASGAKRRPQGTSATEAAFRRGYLKGVEDGRKHQPTEVDTAPERNKWVDCEECGEPFAVPECWSDDGEGWYCTTCVPVDAP